jgi:hypothetical protein
MSVNTEVIYQLKLLLSTVDMITDREARYFHTDSLSYTLWNANVTSILESRATIGGLSTVMVKTTDYSLTSDSITFTSAGTEPDNHTNFYVDYVWTRQLETGEGYPCNPSDLPYVGINVISNVEKPLNAGLFSSRGTDTMLYKVLTYITVFEAKETDADANPHYSRKEMLNATVDAVETKLMKNKKLGDYIVDIQVMGATGRRFDEEINAYYNQLRCDITCIKEARF